MDNTGKYSQLPECQIINQEYGMGKKSILIVEDEQIAAIDLKETLTSLGYRVTGIASSGERAVAMAEADTPDLILMDIHLAGRLSGIEAAEQILQRHEVPLDRKSVV
jgi:CheY-like chemotaxis protein